MQQNHFVRQFTDFFRQQNHFLTEYTFSPGCFLHSHALERLCLQHLRAISAK
jgi:hypothetical protein